MKKVIALIPVHRECFSDLENFSVQYSIDILKRHEISFFGPKSLDKRYYKEQYPTLSYFEFDDQFFGSVNDYSRLLMDVGFYKRFQEYEFLLILQPDAIVIHDDLDFWTKRPFDYVGAPWPDAHDLRVTFDIGRFSGEYAKQVKLKVGNGGLSLRRVKKCINIIEEFPEEIRNFQQRGINEDLFFASAGMISGDFVMPNEIIASHFSLELAPAYYYHINGHQKPMGGHSWWKYEPKFWLSFLKNPPEFIVNQIFGGKERLEKSAIGSQLSTDVLKVNSDISPLERLRRLKLLKSNNVYTENANQNDRRKSEDLFDVTIIIPAFRYEFFEVALKSALNQQGCLYEILIADDSDGDMIHEIVRRYENFSDVPLRYVRNITRKGEARNVIDSFREARGKYIKLLYDDDWLAPNCISRLFRAFEDNPQASLASSRRLIIDDKGKVLSTNSIAYQFPFDGDSLIDGNDLISFLADYPINFIGEPTVVMFKKNQALHFGENFFNFNGKEPVYGFGDLAAWVNLLQQGCLIMLNENLSAFRIHSNQHSQQFRHENDNAYARIAGFKKRIREIHPRNSGTIVKASLLSNPDNVKNINIAAKLNIKTKVENTSINDDRINLFLSTLFQEQNSLNVLRGIKKQFSERFFHEHMHILYNLRSILGPQQINYVEIGTYVGHSAALILSHDFPTAVYCIDPCILPPEHYLGKKTQEQTIRDNLNKIGKPYTLLKNFSGEIDVLNFFKKNRILIDLLFIDGDHRYQAVLKDFFEYAPMMRSGGFIVFDDYWDSVHSPEVHVAVDEIVAIIKKESLNYEIIGSPENMQGAIPALWKNNKNKLNEFILRKN